MRRPARLITATLVSVAALIVPALSATAAGSAPTSGRASSSATVARDATATPYSDPIYYPVRRSMHMDCYKKTVGCNGFHARYQLSLVTSGPIDPSSYGVYAMGAGKVVEITTGKPCGEQTGHTDFGTQIVIDHGAGVKSRIGHLKTGSITVNVGDYVQAGQRLATMGNTGARTCADHPYIDFYVKHGSQQIDFRHLTACVAGTSQQWPHDQYPQFDTWSDVPKFSVAPHAEFPNPTTSPADIPDSTCIPAAPTGPAQPSSPVVTNAGSGKLQVAFGTVPVGVDQIMTETQFYSVTLKRWVNAEWKYGIDPSATSYTVGGLVDGRQARVHVAFHSGDSWSVFSPFTERTVGAPPLPPKNRVLSTAYQKSSHTSAIQWGWKSGKRRGFPTRSYVVGIRKGTSGTWHDTVYSAKTYSHRFTGLKPGTTYQLRIKAHCAIGDSGYLKKSIKTATK